MSGDTAEFHLNPLILKYQNGVKSLDLARDYYNKGNLAQVDLLCRAYLEHNPDDSSGYSLLGNIADRIGLTAVAIKYFTKSVSINPADENALWNLDLLQDHVYTTSAITGAAVNLNHNKYLLIKSWGYGFWSDIDHVLGQLLICEITGRVPIIHWGTNSLFADICSENAFDLYFEPVSEFSIHDLLQSADSFFPPKWNRQNLLKEDINKWEGRYSKTSGILSLSRKETVIVSDFHTQLDSIVPWIHKDSELHGIESEELYRKLYKKYIHPKTSVSEKVDSFWDSRMVGYRWIAVHVRGTDKEKELKDLAGINSEYFKHLEQILKLDSEMKLFLLTDSSNVIDEYVHKYGSKVLFTESLRNSDTTGVHYSGYPGRKVAEEVIVDTYLAAKCDYFLGNGGSNVSTTIQHLKEWGQDRYRLIGENRLFKKNFFLHDK